MNSRWLIGLGLICALAWAAATALWPTRPTPASAQVLPGGGAGGGAEAATNRYFTPRSFDADGLTELFDRVARNGGIAHLPAGTYRINRTIRLEGIGPIRIEGESYGLFVRPRGDGFRAQATRLVWTGEPGGTMFHLLGSVGQSFSHIYFDGGGRAGKLFQISSKRGFGTASQRFERLVLGGADVAIQCGDKEEDFNCADIIYDDVTFWGCKTGLRVVNHQSVNHHFRSLAFQQVGTVFDFERGGNLLVDGWQGGTFDLLLRVAYGGPNAGMYRLVAGRPEMNGWTRRYARLLDAGEVKDMAHLVFDGTQETSGPYDQKLPDNPAEPVFRVGKGATLVVRDHYHFRPPVEFTTGGVYKDHDSRWQLDLPAAVQAATTARGGPAVGTVRITGAADPHGKPLDDLKR